MHKRLSETKKQQLVEQYQNGMPVASLCAEASVFQSTLYSWINAYKITEGDFVNRVTLTDYNALSRKVKRQEDIIQILKTVNCTIGSVLNEKLDELEALHGKYSVRVLCDALEVSRGTFYNHIFRNKRDNSSYEKRWEDLRVAVREAFDEYNQMFGAGIIRTTLTGQGYQTSEKMVTELMREMGLCSIRTSAKRNYNIQTKLGRKTKGNILNRKFNESKPNKVWVSYITCFKMKNKYYFICIILDLFSRKIIAQHVSKGNSTQLVTITFRKAIKERQPSNSLIFHSDRGAPYVSNTFRKLLQEHNVQQSLSNFGQPHDNAVSESFFSSMKQEELYRGGYTSERELRKGVDQYIIFYNTRRPHSAMNNKIPDKIKETYWNKAMQEIKTGV